MWLLPHGGYPLVPATLSSMAWISALSQDGCDFVKVTGNAVNALIQLTNENNNINNVSAGGMPPYAEVGFQAFRIPRYDVGNNVWQVFYDDGCIDYPNNDQDESNFKWNRGGLWEFGSFMHTLATIFGGAGCLYLWIMTIGMVSSKRIWRLGGVKLIIAALCNLLSFFWFGNNQCEDEETECHLFYGSKVNISSLFFYAAAAFAIFYKYPDPKPLKRFIESMEDDLSTYEHDSRHAYLKNVKTAIIEQNIGSDRKNSTRIRV